MHLPFVALSCLIACSFAGAAESRPATSPSPQAPPGASAVTCALLADSGLGLADSPLVALLEVRLSEHPGLRLVERREVEKVLAEQKLQAAFAPEATAQRANLGELLRADLLILLQAREGPQRVIEVVICETRAGLRLCVETIEWNDDVDGQSTAMLRSMLQDALLKHAQRGNRLVAVPPFVSRDFLSDRNYLQQVFARTAEEALIAVPSVLVVEIGEARAIADEIRVSSGNSGVHRDLPFYLAGEYQHVSEGETRKVKVRLALQHAEKMRGERASEALLPDEALAFVREAARSLLSDASPAEGESEPETEVRQLVAHAASFAQRAHWAEALQLIEAAILLMPSQPELRVQAVGYANERAWQLLPKWSSQSAPTSTEGDPEYLSRGLVALDCYRAGIEHGLAWMNLCDFRGLSPAETGLLWRIDLEGWRSWDHRFYTAPAERELQRRSDELRKAYVESVFAGLERKVAAGELTVDKLSAFQAVTRADWEDVSRLRFIRAIKDLPKAELTIINLVCSGAGNVYKEGRYEPVGFDAYDDGLAAKLVEPKTAELLDALATVSGVAAQNAHKFLCNARDRAPGVLGKAAAIHKAREDKHAEESKRLRAEWARDSRPAEPATAQVPDIRFESVRLHLADDGDHAWQDPVLSWVQCGDGLDAVICADRILLMRKRGRLETAYAAEERMFLPSPGRPTAVFDGRYLWAAATAAKDPCVVVLDTVSGKTRTLTTRDGLPPMLGLCIAAITPGKAAVAGAFGRDPGDIVCDRSWCAAVTLAEDGRPTVEMLIESAQLPPSRKNSFEPFKEELSHAFMPQYLARLRDVGRPDDVILVLFRTGGGGASSEPVIIPVGKAHPRLLGERMPYPIGPRGAFPPQPVAVCGSSLHVFQEWSLWSMGMSDLKPVRARLECVEKVIDGRRVLRGYPHSVCPAAMASSGGTLHVLVQNDWWVASCGSAELRRLNGSLPTWRYDVADIRESSHYGLVLLLGQDADFMSPYQVRFADGVMLPSRADSAE